MSTSLAERWRTAREAAGLGFNELDRAIGRERFSTKIENGVTLSPNLDDVAKAAEATGVHPGWLAFGVEPERWGPSDVARSRLSASALVSRLLRFRNLCKAVEAETSKSWTVWHLIDVVLDSAGGEDRTVEEWISVLDRHAIERGIEANERPIPVPPRARARRRRPSVARPAT